MAILIIGGTGQIGSLVLKGLAAHGAAARVLTTAAKPRELPTGMTAVKGDLLDPASLRAALPGIDTMFLLVSVSPSELTQSLIALDLAREAGVAHVVYFSQIVLNWLDCPHTAAKAAAEAMIRHEKLPATILRPAYFYQNDRRLKDAVLGGTYPIPIGSHGAEMVDIRDIADVAVHTILDKAAPDGDRIVEIAGPENITGERAAAIWSEVTGGRVAYGGDDLGRGFEEQQAQKIPGWQAHDLAAMFRGCQREGMHGARGASHRLEKMLGRPLRTYGDFARETFEEWRKASTSQVS